jgi:hypothetical protein
MNRVIFRLRAADPVGFARDVVDTPDAPPAGAQRVHLLGSDRLADVTPVLAGMDLLAEPGRRGTGGGSRIGGSGRG